MDLKEELAKIRKGENYFKYQPLPPHCIRVFHITPEEGEGNDDQSSDLISTSVKTVNLLEDPQYVTLSYTWGRPTPLPAGTEPNIVDCEAMFPIPCDGMLMLGTRNLVHALLHVRRLIRNKDMFRRLSLEHCEGLPIWVDAISINQDDIAERNSQVALMQDIYRRSQLTFSWLGHDDGESTDNAARIMKMVYDLPLEVHLTASERNCHGWFDEESQKRCGIEKPLTHKDCLDLCKFFSPIWFFRAWVMQEIILSRNMILMCGARHAYGWQFFQTTVRFLRETSLFAACRREVLVDVAADPELHFLFEEGEVEKMLGIVQMAKSILPARLSFYEASVLTSMTSCTDPRDKMYGILGFAKELNEGPIMFMPDYNKSIADVYVEALGIALAQTGLAPLNIFQDPALQRTPGLPSWCPDYSIKFQGARGIHEDEVASSVSRLLPHIPAFVVPNSHLLSVHGIRITTIDETCSYPTQNECTPANYCKVLEFMERLDTQDGPYVSLGQNRMELLWRTLLNDRFSGKRPASVNTLQLMAQTAAFFWMLAIPNAELDITDAEISTAELTCLRLQQSDPSSTPFLPSFGNLRNFLDAQSTKTPTLHSVTLPDGRAGQMLMRTALKTAEGNYRIKATESFCNDVYSQLGLDIYANRRDVGEIRDKLRTLANNYTVFRTNDGRLGTGTKSVQAGDELWVLSTGPVPYILRPSAGASGRYQFLGRADIHAFSHKDGLAHDQELTNLFLE